MMLHAAYRKMDMEMMTVQVLGPISLFDAMPRHEKIIY